MPTSEVVEVAAMRKAAHAQEDRAARQKAEQVAAKLREMKLADAAALIVAGSKRYYVFPGEFGNFLHWVLRGSAGVYSALNQDPANVT